MNRPMPGPPEEVELYREAHIRGKSPRRIWWRNSDGTEGDLSIRHVLKRKRLTRVECAAHYWQAEADEMVHNYTWHDSDFRDEEADDAYAHIRATWRRFKDTPHALEES